MLAVKVYDVSVPLHEGMVIYPGDPPLQLEYMHRISEGAGANNSWVCFGAHTGTHLDAPHHFIDGAATVEQVATEALIGPARVFRLDVQEAITAEDLRPLDWEGVRRPLFRTRNSSLWRQSEFAQDFVYLTKDAAEFLVERRPLLAGVDYLSVDRFHAAGHPAHKALLGAGILALEGLDLSQVPPGDYFLFCGLLPVVGAEAAPARVFLLEDKN